MLTPYLAGILLLTILPALLALGLAFFRYDGLSAPQWVRWENFQLLQWEPLFFQALMNSLFFAVTVIPLRLLGALGVALLLIQERPGARWYRAIVCLPSIIPDVAYALAWLWLLNPLYGPINGLLHSMGLPAPAWLADFRWAKPGLALMWVFQIAEGFILLLAGLKSQPREALDAAQVDGASKWQVLRWITLPLLTPWLVLLAVRDTLLSMQATLTPTLLMTGGDPYYATLFLPLLIYEEAFAHLRFGQGHAIALIQILITLVLIFLVFGLSGGWGYDDE